MGQFSFWETDVKNLGEWLGVLGELASETLLSSVLPAVHKECSALTTQQKLPSETCCVQE